PDSGLVLPLLTHLGMAACVGAAGGLAFGLGRGGPGSAFRGLLSGLFGGMVGAVLYEMMVATAYPLVKVYEPIPTELVPRILLHFSVAVLTALVAGLNLEARPEDRAAPPASAA